MALYAPASKRIIPPGPSDPAIDVRALILHVDAGNASSLFGWFNGPSGGVESHFHIRKDGSVEQYRDTAFQADANVSANAFAISVETQGLEHGEWTDEQITAIKALILWAHKEHGVPLRVCRTSTDSGIGYHTLFPGAWDTRGASCPGPDRKEQFRNIIVPWLLSSPEKATDYAPRNYTRDDVARFQRVLRLDDDGLWGPETERQAQAIRRVLKSGMKSNRWDVARYWRLRLAKGHDSTRLRRGIQWALRVPVDGVWGPRTDQAWLDMRSQHRKA